MRAYNSRLKEKVLSTSAILTENINLEVIYHFLQGTEHFVSDLHGEYATFDYILRTGSGTIQTKPSQPCWVLTVQWTVNT